MNSVVETVAEIVTPILGERNLEPVEVEFVKERRSWLLWVFIDKEGGIDIEEYVFASERLSEKFDATDPGPIPQAYFLGVSSPEAERLLKKESDYKKAFGDYVYVSLYRPVDGEKQYGGFLQSLNVEQFTLKVRVKVREEELTFD